MKKIILLALLFGINAVYAADLQSAKVLKSVSQKATEKVISEFKKGEVTKVAYIETKEFIATQLLALANEGFYDVTYVLITSNGDTKNMKLNKLSDKDKDMLKSILKTELKALGYKVEDAKYDSIGLHWAISW